MTYSYKLINDFYTGEPTSVRRSDGWSIPFAPDNSDYQEYLKWVAESPDNVPLPADE
jgi:hypothetical protein